MECAGKPPNAGFPWLNLLTTPDPAICPVLPLSLPPVIQNANFWSISSSLGYVLFKIHFTGEGEF